MQYSIAFRSRQETANDVMVYNGVGSAVVFLKLLVADKAVKLPDRGLNRSQEIRPKGKSCRRRCFFRDNCRAKVAGDVISGATEVVRIDVLAKFGDSRLNHSKIVRLFVGWTCSMHFYAVLNCILQPTGSR